MNRTAGLPQEMREILFQEIPEGKTWRSLWDMWLSFDSDNVLNNFMKALDSEDIGVHEDQVESDPCEICVRASGDCIDGTYWRDLNIVLLSPWWSSTADASRGLAGAIVDRWDDLRALRLESRRVTEPSAPVP
jgi:hypothetical protein